MNQPASLWAQFIEHGLGFFDRWRINISANITKDLKTIVIHEQILDVNA